MANHVLSLEVPDTLNSSILRVVDTSIYNSQIAVTCPQLLITVPGFSYSTLITEPQLEPGFILNLTACDLEIQKAQCGSTYYDIPDGIYAIKYSVSPNEVVYVEYNHLRITAALKMIQEVLCDLDLGACDPPTAIKDILNKVTMVKRYLDAAKAKVEFCHEPEKGMQLYSYALKMLKKIGCKSC
jgi:hypothetical protein